jgi:hypothetical protein
MSEPTPPLIERYGYTWIQHPDGLYYGPLYPSDDDQLAYLREGPSGLVAEGKVGMASVRRGEYRYFLRHPEEEGVAC